MGGGGGGGGEGGCIEIGSSRRQKLGLYDEQYFGQGRYNPTTYRYYEPENKAKLVCSLKVKVQGF